MMSSSSSHQSSFSEYDVFINHRGPDVKQTVAFAIYNLLVEKGFKPFLDDEDLQLGDAIGPAIRDAIYSSKVQIAIFSPRYAESPWCLNELLHMGKTKALFIPVFCDVNPYDLRYPHKGVYALDFARHHEKGRFSDDIIQLWTGALSYSSNISGYEFSTSNDNVEKLCTEIALTVEKEIVKLKLYRQRRQVYRRKYNQVSAASISAQSVVGMSPHMGFPRYVRASAYQICVGADSAASASTLANKKPSLLPRDSHPVGIDYKVEDMVRFLQDPQFPVIAVVGMGGLGKTFLLQNVYKKTKSSFERSVWLSISKSYSVKNLQHDIAFRLDLKVEIVDSGVSEEIAADLINERLEGKTCLIVLDDLWALSAEDNLLDKLGLPKHKDCKVLVTTRNKDVAHTLEAHIYEIQMLSDEESWELFCFYAFPDCEDSRAPPHLEEVGHEIVKECGNLPLAIKTTAASLAKNTSLSKWDSKRDQLKKATFPIGQQDTIMEILKLSYDSLAEHLKPCFAYLSFFPEDAMIDPEYLIYLWVAEGFLPAGEDPWDIAWDWLHQLDQLCLLQQWEDLRSGRLTKHCKIHDLLHDLAIRISRQNNSAFSVEEACTYASDWCRILLAKKDVSIHALSHNTHLRTLSLSQSYWGITNIPENLFNAMRGLLVLDLSSTLISTLPESVGKMILLKILNLRNTRMERVPECIRYLKSLLFLALPMPFTFVPEWINELKCLQHLECNENGTWPKGIYKMVSLRTLRSTLALRVKDDLAKMTRLQELRLLVENDMELQIVSHLVNLRHLEVYYCIHQTKHLLFPETMRTMKHLEVLMLERVAVPSWIVSLANLRELDLRGCVYSDFPEFQRMPNLVRLNLIENKGCKELPEQFGMSGGFRHLRFLRVSAFTDLEEFPRLEEGAMPYLEEFVLWRCKNLKNVKKVGEELVEGLERLKRLKKFIFEGEGDQQREVVNLFQQQGEYWNRIKAGNSHVKIEARSYI